MESCLTIPIGYKYQLQPKAEKLQTIAHWHAAIWVIPWHSITWAQGSHAHRLI